VHNVMVLKHGFTRFILARLGYLVASYFVTITIIFFLPRLVPGNPLMGQIQNLMMRLGMGVAQPEAISEAWKVLIRTFGIGRPIQEQYLRFLTALFTGNFGYSIQFYPKAALELVIDGLPYTLILLIPSTLTAWVIGNTLGAFAGYRWGSLGERVTTSIVVVLAQIPAYWMAFLFVYLFVATYKLFPAGGAWSVGMVPSFSIAFIADFLWHYALPYLTIVLTSVFGWYLGMRVISVYELGADYIAFSESLGVKDGIIFRYVYRNSLLPQITGLAISLGGVLGGQTLVENIFRYPGTGFVLARAVGGLDYPVIQAVFVILVATLFTANFLVDFIYALVDPRIRIGGG